MSIYQFEERRTCGSCLRYLFIVANIVLLLVGSALIAVFVYLLVTQVEFVRGVLGTDLVVTACGLLIASGCLLFLLAVFGFFSGIFDKLGAYSCYLVVLVPAFLAVLAAVICALVFKTWLTDQVRYKMQNAIRTSYGVNLDNSWNKRITESWDKAQEQWKCCSVDDKSWNIYQESQWYKEQSGTPGNPTNWKAMVPKSCCKLDSTGYISNENLRECQSKVNGPPTMVSYGQYAGEYNNELYYRGCYQAARDFLIYDTVSWFGILVGVGSAVAILLLIMIALTVALVVVRKHNVKRTSYIAEYSQRSDYTPRSGAVLY